MITYVIGMAIRAHVTTVASKIFQPSLQYDPGCKIKPKSRIYKIKKALMKANKAKQILIERKNDDLEFKDYIILLF